MAADFNYAVTRVACNTSTGPQDITESGFGTVKAAIFTLVRATTNDIVSNGLGISRGFTDGTSQFVASTQSQNGVGTQNTDRNYATDEVVMLINTSGTIDGEANFDSFITDGVRINWGNAIGGAYLLQVELFGGTDFSAKVGIIDLGNTDRLVTTVSGLSFAPTGLVTTGVGRNAVDSINAIGMLQYGLACVRGDSVYAVGGNFGAGSGLTMQNNQQLRHCAVATNALNNIDFRVVNIGEFTSDGFSVITDIAAINLDLGYLAMDIAGGTISVDFFKLIASATGNRELIYPTTATPVGASYVCVTNSTDFEFSSVDVHGTAFSATDGTNEFCSSVADQDGVGTSNTQSKSANRLIDVDDDDGTQMRDGTHVSFGAGKHTINISTADNVDRGLLGMMFSDVEETVAGGIAKLAGDSGGLVG